MKNKQINKILFMFVIGMSLFFSNSLAIDIFVNGETFVTSSNYYFNGTKESISIPNIGLTASELGSKFYAYMGNVSSEPFYNDDDFNILIDDILTYYNELYGINLDSYFIYRTTKDAKNGSCFLFDSSEADFIVDSESIYYAFSFASGSSFIFSNFNSSSIGFTLVSDTVDSFYTVNYSNSFSVMPFRSNCSLKKLTSRSYVDGVWCIEWDGESYYQKVEDEPEVEFPVFETSLTDDEIASIVSNFTNSMHWKNRDSVYNQFFIQCKESENYYLLVLVSDYMYKYLSGLYIPDNVSSNDYEAMDYDTYSILFNDGVSGTFFPWQTDRFNYKIYNSYDGITFTYCEEMDCKDFNEYRFPMTSPVIYSSFYLPFKTLLGNKISDSGITSNDYSEEIDLKFSELVNSETDENYVFEGLEVKSNEETNEFIAALSSAVDVLVESIAGVFNLLIDQIFNFSDFLLESYGENVVTLVFAILIKSVTILVASIGLIFRAVGFILSLVAIPASSALLSVDVATNTSGLVFSGLNWGKQFVDGLDFVKKLSWNGLGLWTLFESFVSALEIVLFVKIVKKHYSHTL